MSRLFPYVESANSLKYSRQGFWALTSCFVDPFCSLDHTIIMKGFVACNIDLHPADSTAAAVGLEILEHLAVVPKVRSWTSTTLSPVLPLQT